MNIQPERNCPDCDVAMDRGFVPDFAYEPRCSQQSWRTWWLKGAPEGMAWKSLAVGNVKIDASDAVPVVSFRCPKCGLLREYATQ